MHPTLGGEQGLIIGVRHMQWGCAPFPVLRYAVAPVTGIPPLTMPARLQRTGSIAGGLDEG